MLMTIEEARAVALAYVDRGRHDVAYEIVSSLLEQAVEQIEYLSIENSRLRTEKDA